MKHTFVGTIGLTLACIAGAFLVPATALGTGINLSWDDCGTAGTESKAFACNTNTGTPFVLVGSFEPPAGVNQFAGLSASVRITPYYYGSPLPDWWKFGNGQCRGSALVASYDFTNNSACTDVFYGNGLGSYVFSIEDAGRRGRIRFSVGTQELEALDPGTEYYAFKAQFGRAKTSGSGNCAGCIARMNLQLDEIQLFQPPQAANDPTITNPLQRTTVTWQPNAPNATIRNIVPNAGDAGTVVTISGTNLSTTNSAWFGDQPAAAFSVVSDSVVTATAPVDVRTSSLRLQTQLGSVVFTGPGTYLFYAPPRQVAFTNRRAPVGGVVFVEGVNLSGATGVLFGGTPASVVEEYSASMLRTEVPSGAASGPITVTNPAGSASTSASFTVGAIDTATSGFIHLAWDNCSTHGYRDELFACNATNYDWASLVASFVPPAGNPTIVGYEGSIRLSTESALPDWWKHGFGQCRNTNNLFPWFHKTHDLACTNALQQGGTASVVNYQIAHDGPSTARIHFAVSYPQSMKFTLDSSLEYYAFVLDINRGNGGTSCAGCSVPAAFELQSIQLYRAAGEPEDRAMTRSRDGRLAYWQPTQPPPPPAPQIASFDPPGGPPATVVTLHGSGFATTQEVSFRGAPASFTIVDDTELRATVPAAARTAPILVRNAATTAFSSAEFVLAPILESFVPQQAPAGHVVRLTGRNLDPTDEVRFNGTAATFQVHGDSLLDAYVPPGATTGPITVENVGGSAISSTAFQVGALTGVGELPVAKLELGVAVPNPSSGEVRWTIALPHAGRVRVAILDAAGSRVRTLASDAYGAGRHDLIWDGRNERGEEARPGRYFVMAEVDGRTLRRSFVRLR